jgi:hypothetical protein
MRGVLVCILWRIAEDESGLGRNAEVAKITQRTQKETERKTKKRTGKRQKNEN